MNSHNKSILLEGCHHNHGGLGTDKVKVVGQHGQATYINACVLSFIVPWLSSTLKSMVT